MLRAVPLARSALYAVGGLAVRPRIVFVVVLLGRPVLGAVPVFNQFKVVQRKIVGYGNVLRAVFRAVTARGARYRARAGEAISKTI